MSSIVSMPLSSAISSTISHFFPKLNFNFYPEFFNDIMNITHSNTNDTIRSDFISLINEIKTELDLGAIKNPEDIKGILEKNIILNIYNNHKERIIPFINICLKQKNHFLGNKLDFSPSIMNTKLNEQIVMGMKPVLPPPHQQPLSQQLQSPPQDIPPTTLFVLFL